MAKAPLTLSLGDEKWKADVDVAAFLVEIVVRAYDCKVTHAIPVSDAILKMDDAARAEFEVRIAREIGRDLAENNEATETVGCKTTSGYVVGVESLRAAGFSERLIAALEIRDDQPDNRGVELPDQYVLIEEHDWFESVEPTEPKCNSETGHEWASWGERGQGGAIVETEACAHCGVYRIENFWMVREPEKIVSYHAADDRSLEWLKSEVAFKIYSDDEIRDFVSDDIRGYEEFGGPIATTNGSLEATVAADGTIAVMYGDHEIAVGEIGRDYAGDGAGFDAAVAVEVECWEDSIRNGARTDDEDEDEAVDQLRDEADAYITDLGRAWVNAVRARIAHDADADVES